MRKWIDAAYRIFDIENYRNHCRADRSAFIVFLICADSL